jgi:hypothetical protein
MFLRRSCRTADRNACSLARWILASPTWSITRLMVVMMTIMDSDSWEGGYDDEEDDESTIMMIMMMMIDTIAVPAVAPC